MSPQGLYTARLSWHNSHVGSTWSWYMMWSGEIFFRSLERSNFWSAWPSSIDGDLCYRNNSPIAIYVIVLFCQSQFHAIVLFCRSRFTWSCYFANRDLRDCVILVGPRFKPRASMIFYWSWAQFPGQIACFRTVWFMAYVTPPHKWWIRVMEKKPHGREKMQGDCVKHKTLVERRLSLVGIFFKIRCYSPNI